MIETAKDKLALDERPISQIAYELGFEYPQYFTRLFKRQTGNDAGGISQTKVVPVQRFQGVPDYMLSNLQG